MKSFLYSRALLYGFLLVALGTWNANAAFRNWTNTLGGNWFEPGNWSPNGVPGNTDAVTITNSGTYTVLIPTGIVSTAVITLGGGSGKQTLIYGTATGSLFITNSTVQANGLLVVTNGGLQGALLVQSGGELQLNAPNNLFLYNFALANEGTFTWSNGALSVGGSNSDTTTITNSGLWQITGNNNINYGGGSRPRLVNSGTVRKLNGTGTTIFSGMDLINLPSGVADVSSGTLQFSAFATNVLGGSFTASTPGLMKFTGTQTDAGGAASGTGTFQFTSGTFYFRTNTIPQLKLVGGDVYIAGTNSFQQAGAITNLTLDGSQLRGTNLVAGTLTVNSGNLLDRLTVQPSGQLLLAASGGSLLYACNIINQGKVAWSGGSLAVGGTPGTVISNGGTWTITSDAALSFGGGTTAFFTNSGTIEKTGGNGVSSLAGVAFINLPSGVVRAGSGTLQMPLNYTNTAGELQLNGGAITAGGTFNMTGGTLDGTGTIGANAIVNGGTISPGPTVGVIRFQSGLALGLNATLIISGTGTVPGTQYGQLSVGGAVTISNATLLVSSLPAVPTGTSFVIITNTSANSTAGAFNGLPENSQFTISGQPFRLNYGGGTGNDIVLVRDSRPLISSGTYENNTFRVRGTGLASTLYAIEATTNFMQWTSLGTVTSDLSGAFDFTDTNAINFPYRFYRISN